MLSNIGWINFNLLYSNAVKKEAFKIINSSEDNELKYKLIYNRNRRNLTYNRVAPHDVLSGWNNTSQNSFIYKTKQEYNKLPKLLTLCPNFLLFKKYLKLYTLNKNCNFPKRNEFELIDSYPEINIARIFHCQNPSLN